MVDRFVRVGSLKDIHVYDDADFDSAVETDHEIRCGSGIDGSSVLRQDDIGDPSLGLGDVIGPTASVDSNLVEFNGITGKVIKDGGLSHANTLNAINLRHARQHALNSAADHTGNEIKTDHTVPTDLIITTGAQRTLLLGTSIYDDLRFPVGSVKGAGAYPPADQPYKGGIVLAFDTGPNSESIQFVAQLPHTYKEGTDLEFHLHWLIATDGAGIGAENVKWDFTYSWANIDGSFPGEDTQSLTVDVQNRVADKHYLDDVYTINGAGKTISSILICSLTRDISVANDYADDAYFLEADFHYEIDTLGSRQQGVK